MIAWWAWGEVPPGKGDRSLASDEPMCDLAGSERGIMWMRIIRAYWARTPVNG